jgi:hypothetical protein
VTLSDLASVGRFVSGLAVLVSLIYLARQTRQNTLELRQSELARTHEQFSNWRTRLIESPEVTELLRRGLSDPESIDETGRARIDLILEDLMWLNWQFWNRSRGILSDQEIFNRSSGKNLKLLLATPTGANWWKQHRDEFDSEFQAIVQSYIRGTG